MISYDVPVGVDEATACAHVCGMAFRADCPATMTFQGCDVVCNPGDSPGEIAERLFLARQQRARETVATIMVEVTRGRDFTIRLGEYYYDGLTFDEMIGCLIRLTLNGDPSAEKAGYGGLKTKAQWEAYRASLDDNFTRHATGD